MKKLKIITILGTRPEIIRLSKLIKLLDKEVDHKLLHTGQNYDYELNQIFFDDLELRKPDHFLNAAGSNGAETIGNVIIAVDKLLAEEAPDADHDALQYGPLTPRPVVRPARRLAALPLCPRRRILLLVGPAAAPRLLASRGAVGGGRRGCGRNAGSRAPGDLLLGHYHGLLALAARTAQRNGWRRGS